MRPNICQCFADWTGERCDQPSCSQVNDCSDHGSCVGPQVCNCTDGWTTALDCSVPACDQVNNCGGNGQCVSPQVCECAPGFAGQECELCQGDRWGSVCQCRCPTCIKGTCLRENGDCQCDTGWAGNICDRCAENYFGPDCLSLPATNNLAPLIGHADGGQNITITGVNFQSYDNFTCLFDEEQLSSQGTWIDQSTILCRVPRWYYSSLNIVFHRLQYSEPPCCTPIPRTRTLPPLPQPDSSWICPVILNSSNWLSPRTDPDVFSVTRTDLEASIQRIDRDVWYWGLNDPAMVCSQYGLLGITFMNLLLL